VWGCSVYLLLGFVRASSEIDEAAPHLLYYHLTLFRSRADAKIVMDLKVGDVVRLKSGGPEMTVSECPVKTIDGKTIEGQVDCSWFKESPVHHVFKVDDLIKVSENETKR
jgi:uncharacterized protein YodC (DUF2158 family)